MMQSYSANLKKRAPLWVWALLLIFVITVAVLAVLHFTGFYDLSFLGAWYLSAFAWAGAEIVNAFLLTAGIAIVGAGIFYFFKTYVFGYKATLPATGAQPVYQSSLSPPTIQPVTQQIIEDVKK